MVNAEVEAAPVERQSQALTALYETVGQPPGNALTTVRDRRVVEVAAHDDGIVALQTVYEVVDDVGL